MKKYFVQIIFFFFWANFAVAEGPICSQLPPLPAGADDLRIKEHEITKSKYSESLDFIRNEFPRRLLSYEKISEYEQNTEFWLSYYNSLKFIEGYVLKQAAEQEIQIKKQKGKAAAEFCSFLKEAMYVD